MQSPQAWQSGRERFPARIAGTAGQFVFLTHTSQFVHVSLFTLSFVSAMCSSTHVQSPMGHAR